MITEINSFGEVSGAVTLTQNNNVTDEIKRNHLQSEQITKIPEPKQPTDFAVKFARLKKSLRRRSSNIF